MATRRRRGCAVNFAGQVKKKARSPIATSGYHATLPPLWPEPRSPSAAVVARRLFSPAAILHSGASDSPSSVGPLPPLTVQAGPRQTSAEGPARLTASTPSRDMPVGSLTDEELATGGMKTVKTMNPVPPTVTEVVQALVNRRDLGDLRLYYLREVEGDSYRPYDLRVVHASEAGSEYYIFSPNTVLHVTERGYGGLVSLAEWYRESVLWKYLQEIPFFKDFRMRKGFTWWHRNVRKIIFKRKCEHLQSTLLLTVPQFRDSLLLLSRIIEELKETHWLPQDESTTYTLPEFKNLLMSKNQECLQVLRKLSHCHTFILNKVREDSHKAHQELQLHLECAGKLPERHEPIHLHLAHQQRLKVEFSRAENILLKLGNFAALIHQMVVQSLVTITRRDVTSFLNNVLKVSERLASWWSAQDSTSDTCPTPAGGNQESSGWSGHREFSCCRRVRDQQARRLLLTPTGTTFQGQRVHGCYYPLSRGQLLWHLHVHDVSKQAEQQQNVLMQEAQSELQQLCERYTWLLDIHQFLVQWSLASSDGMKGQPALVYQEHIEKIRCWIETVHTIPPSILASNQLIIIRCSNLKEHLGRQLRLMEDKVLQQLVEQMKLQSESLVSDLERTAADLKTEPRNLDDFSKYTLRVKDSVKSLAGMQERLENACALQDVVCRNYREMTEEELTLKHKMLDLWNCFLSLLREAESSVGLTLPPMSNAVDTMFSFLVCDLKNLVSDATGGPFLDPTKNADEMVSKLNCMCLRGQTIQAKLEQFSRTREALQENPMGSTVLTTNIQLIKARRELWELVALYRTWIQEWRTTAFTEVVISQAQEKIVKWQQQVESLTGIIPTHDAVLQEALETLGNLSRQLAIMAELQSSALKHSHWTAVLQGVGLPCDPERNVTVGELMSQKIEVHQKLIKKVGVVTCRDARAESAMEETFLKIQQEWRGRLFQMEEFRFAILNDGLSAMESVSIQMIDRMDSLFEQFPRLWFLSDREVIELLSFHATPSTLLPFVRKLFKGVRRFEMDCKETCNTADVKGCGASCDGQMKVLGVFGSLQEHITFRAPLEPNHNPLAWLCTFENQFKLTMEQLMIQCAGARNKLQPANQDLAGDRGVGGTQKNVLPVLSLLSRYPLQCLLVAEETVWHSVTLQAFQESSPVKLSDIKAYNSAKLENLSRSIRDRVTEPNIETLASKYTTMCLRAFVQLTMKHIKQLSQLMQVQREPALSFEWLSFLKYHVSSDRPSLKRQTDSACYVDVLDHRLQLGYEYFGPKDWLMVHTPSTDRGILGILLALTSYSGGFVSGPGTSGKKKTVVQLGRALGRQVVIIECCPSTRPDVIHRRLCGALLTGAWLLLDSVDLLSQGVQSLLAQHLEDIHQSFSELTRKKRDHVNEKLKDVAADGVTAFKGIPDPEFHLAVVGKSLCARPSYGCVLISSKGHSTEVPQSLRFSTRPVALTLPDYRIIAEVLLTSIGFLEAVSLSHRLVSFISLAKDSLCLPGFIIEDQSGFLIILQKIISATEMRLQQSVRQREILNGAKNSATKQTDLTSQHNVTAGVDENKEDTEKPFRWYSSSHFSIGQELLEETVFVQAINSVLSPVMNVTKKASHFYDIFKDTFPLASQFPLFQQCMEEVEMSRLRKALTGELERKLFHPDKEIIHGALTLYQTMKLSQAVVLVGLSGSGKSTCYSVLAGALNSLAAKDVEEDTPQAVPQINTLTLTWSFVDTVVIFPNTMSHEELFGGFCEKRGWRDGAVAKVLRDSERRGYTSSETCRKKKESDQRTAVKWLVLDGEPVGRPGWLDCLSTLNNFEDPCLCLSSGEMLAPPRSHLRLLMEITDLSGASPSAVTRCSLVNFTGTDQWKAVWMGEMESLRSEHRLDQGTLTMWNRLAEDLFSCTLTLLRTRAIPNEESCQSSIHGLLEITSFIRILHALLQHFQTEFKPIKADIPLQRTDTSDTDATLKKELFLVAYIWGFGGHLHPRHWPQFDSVVRQALFNSRYKVVVPDEETVFECVFSIDNKILPRNTLLTNSISPKYRKYANLLNLMLEANQPVLLAGEPGSGKTTLCNTLLCFDKPHIRLLASSLQSSATSLRTILTSISCQKTCKNTRGSMARQLGLLLFVDDLHEAQHDVFGKMSKFLETLRESISKGGILTFDTYRFKSLSPGTVKYMAACCVSELDNPHHKVISSRLSGLFSIFVLPSLTIDTMLSIHSPQLKLWLKDMPFIQNVTDTVFCIITTTKNLYDEVCKKFPPTAQRPCFMFSHHDLQKVFDGMCLWKPSISNTEPTQLQDHAVLQGPAATVLRIVHLWMHECVRTFSDRLCPGNQRRTLQSLIAQTAATHYGIRLITEPDKLNSVPTLRKIAIDVLPLDTVGTCNSTSPDALNSAQEPEPAGQSDLEKGTLTEPQILQHLEDIMAKLVYGPMFTEALNSTNRQSDLKFSSSYQERSLDGLVQQVSSLLDQNKEGQEADHDVTSRYVVHRQMMHQLLRITRALAVPGGHGLLIGSQRRTGRKTSVRLAAYLTGSHLIEIHPGNEHELRAILKEAGDRTRVDGVCVIVLVHEEISPSVRDDLLVAMAQRSYPGFHTEQELKNLVSRVSDVRNSRRYLMDCWMFEKYLSQIHRNVHVFLLMPDDSETPANDGIHRRNVQMTKALRLSCCVEVYQPWSIQSLEDVDWTRIRSFFYSNLVKPEDSQAGLSLAMARIHQSACQYASVLLRGQPFSPQTYLEFITHFRYLCIHLDKQWQREKELLKAVDAQRSLLKKAKQKYMEEKKKLHHLEEQISRSQRQVRSVFLSGLKILDSLNPSDLEEVRRYRDPPEGVVRVMDAVCLLFDRPPGWESAKQLLGQPNFFQEMEFFERHTLSNEQLHQLGQIVLSPLFVPESVREVSKACESLCRWVQAVYECCCMQQQVLVKQQLEVLAREVQDRLHLAKTNREDASLCLEDIELQLQMIKKTLEQQVVELRRAESVEREAAAARGQLEGHVREWKAAAQESKCQKESLAGDALILAAAISYLGPFPPDVRVELLNKWRELCQTGSINVNPKDPRSVLVTSTDLASSHPALSSPLIVSERLQLPISLALGLNEWQLRDDSPARLVVKLLLWGCRRAWVQRWLLLADSQHHLEIDSKNWCVTGDRGRLEEELQCELVLCANDPKLLDKLDEAAEKGLRVLVTQVERAVISPWLHARLTRPSRCGLPGLKQNAEQLHPDFCLFLSTHLPVRLLSCHIHASILAQVCVVDLSLSSEEIQEVMLTQLLQSESKELLIQRLRLQNDKQLLQKKLITEEDALMNYILQSKAMLLHNLDFLPQVAVYQEAMEKLQTEIQQLSEGLEYHEFLLDPPRRLIQLAAALYQALQEVSHLSPAYYFSLSSFITVIQEVFIEKGRASVLFTTGKAASGIIAEATNRMVAQLLVHYRPCLFKSHALILKLLVSLAVLQHNHLCSTAERAAFLMGFEAIQSAGKPCSPSATVSLSLDALPGWISPHVHSQLTCLERLPAFRGLTASLASSPRQWQEYLRFPVSPVAGNVPCRSHSHLSLLQRALLWKTLLPHCLERLAEDMAACLLILPAQTETPHSGNPEALSRLLDKHDGPVILSLPYPCQHKWTSIQPLYLMRRLAGCTAETKQVKVISSGGLCDRGFILSTLDEAVRDGHWLVFNDCHLVDRWDEEVVERLHQSISFKESTHTHRRIHPGFRLWFITEENAMPSLPAGVRLCALPLVCDSAWDVREELSCSLRQVASVLKCSSGLAADDVELLLRCVVFHSVLLQRQKYLGRARVDSWSQADLLALAEALVGIASLSRDKTETLQRVAVLLVHGGRVLEPADLQVVESVAQACLGSAPPLLDSGPHLLSKTLSSSDHFGLSELLQVLQQHLQDSVNTSDPLVLGFGADVEDEMTKINSHHLKVLLRASQTPQGITRCSRADWQRPDYDHARDRLQELQRFLARQNDSERPSAGASPSPVRDFLQAEWDELDELVSSLLSQFQRLVQDRTPTFTSLLGLADLTHLERRAELLRAYLRHDNASDPCGAYRLAAFQNARGILVALVRQAAQINRRCISDIVLQFEVLSHRASPASLPLGAVCLCGLELRGASWDSTAGALKPTRSPQPCAMPLICVKARVKKQGSGDAQASEAPPSPSPQFPVFHCPIYVEEDQDTGNWRLAEANIIARVPLRSSLDPVLCSLRRVRLVSSLAAATRGDAF
ncbi:dynein heavy chain domain-containing protein 1 [Aulostomus maculatus]